MKTGKTKNVKITENNFITQIYLFFSEISKKYFEVVNTEDITFAYFATLSFRHKASF